jgi:hypothetical protein
MGPKTSRDAPEPKRTGYCRKPTLLIKALLEAAAAQRPPWKLVDRLRNQF